MSDENKTSESTKFVFIKHKDSETVWKLPSGGAIHSILLRDSIINNPNTESYGILETNPMIIDNIKMHTIPFIVSYMNFYDCQTESNPPEFPLKNIHPSVIFGDEYELYVNIYNSEDTVISKILKLNDNIQSALYFNITHLPKKLCAIIAHIIKDLSLDDVKKISDQL
jgi:hypothetical protein